MLEPSPLAATIRLTDAALDAAADPPPVPPPPAPDAVAPVLMPDELVVESPIGLDISVTPDTVEEAGGTVGSGRIESLPPDLSAVLPRG